jgi:hypothetical protein
MLEELPVGLLSDHATIEERLDVLEQGPLTILHPSPPSGRFFFTSADNGLGEDDCSHFFRRSEKSWQSGRMARRPCTSAWRAFHIPHRPAPDRPRQLYFT